MSRVREVTVPAEVAALAELDLISYGEGFVFASDVSRSPEDWSRLILEGASRRERLTMLGAWRALGVGLLPLESSGQVLGWRIRHRDRQAIVLGIRAAAGVTARIVLRVDGPEVLHTMLVRYDSGLGARIWPRVAPGHRRFVTGLLERAAAA